MLFATRDVTVKLLPFDNKSELQVVVDLPQSSTLEDTERFLNAAAGRRKDLPELTSIQIYAGTAGLTSEETRELCSVDELTDEAGSAR